MIRNFIGVKKAVFSSLMVLFIVQVNVFAADWSYVRKLTVHNPGAATTEAVVEVLLDKTSFDYSRANADGGDLRFSDQSGRLTGTGLSYWIEQWDMQGLSRIWLKLPKLAKGKTSVFMHYGNKSAVPVSNGEATFLFFDDFGDVIFRRNGQMFPLVRLRKKTGC